MKIIAWQAEGLGRTRRFDLAIWYQACVNMGNPRKCGKYFPLPSHEINRSYPYYA